MQTSTIILRSKLSNKNHKPLSAKHVIIDEKCTPDYMTNIRIEVFNKCEQVGAVNVYSIHINKDLTEGIYEEICGLFYNKVIQDCRYYIYNESLEEIQYAFIEPQAEWGLEISFLPGMTENLGSTGKQIVREYLISKDYSSVLLDEIKGKEEWIPVSRTGMTSSGLVTTINSSSLNPPTRLYFQLECREAHHDQG